MSAYYNEWEAYPAQWLRNLIAAGHIAAGDVDERSVKDVKADELKKYTQCHFFAGIGGWSYALRLSGWPDDQPVWTGSCPCQPFSVAGKQKAQSDERHLWPVWFDLIRECSPSTIFGEQVAGAIAHGWLDDAYQGLEAEGYAVGSAVLPACGVGAPHKRDRLWFVAESKSLRREGEYLQTERRLPTDRIKKGCRGVTANAMPTGLEGQRTVAGRVGEEQRDVSNHSGWQFEPAVGRVANGIPAGAHKLRAYGNAIVPQVAAEFIAAFMECAP